MERFPWNATKIANRVSLLITMVCLFYSIACFFLCHIIKNILLDDVDDNKVIKEDALIEWLNQRWCHICIHLNNRSHSYFSLQAQPHKLKLPPLVLPKTLFVYMYFPFVCRLWTDLHVVCKKVTKLNELGPARLYTYPTGNIISIWNLNFLVSLMANSLNLNSAYSYIFRNLFMIAYITEIQR